MIKNLYYLALLILLVSSCTEQDSAGQEIILSQESLNLSQESLNKYDSLRSLIANSRFPRDPLVKEVETISNDSLRNDLFFVLAFYYYRQGDSLEFRRWNNKALKLSSSLNDTSKIAEAHWDLANFQNDYNHSDSSFYHYNRSYNLYNSIKDDYHAGIMLLNMGIIQRNIKDYSGSEVTTVRAIKILEPLGKLQLLYMAYNNLGIIYNEMGEYSKALEYHGTALEYQKQINNSIQLASSLNNVGVLHKNNQKYRKAENFFKRALTLDSISHKNPRLYAMLLDNLAHAKYLNSDTLQVENMFLKALRIREDIDHQAGIAINKIHLAEFYLKQGDTALAKKFIYDAKTLAEKGHNHRDLLTSLLILSKIDKANSENHLYEYIRLNDSLQGKERAVRNKFARIQFETDHFIAENRYLNNQRQWLIGSAVSVLFVLLLFIVILRQKARNKKLALEQEQQRANEEIYNLLLVQQNKVEEGRHKEKERISKELHDGILGRLFGTRLLLESSMEDNSPKSLQKIRKNLNDLRLIEKEVRNISHDLSSDFFSKNQGFIDVLKEYLQDQKQIAKFKLQFTYDENINWDRLLNRIKINLFRIVQEAVNNINKYAQASEVSISCTSVDDFIETRIRDNGKGFDINDIRKGIGLKNIGSRVESLNGTLELSSDKDGTLISFKIPLKYDDQ